MSLRNTMMVLALAAASACSGSQRPTASYRYAGRDPATMTDVDIRPGPMPDNETFSGSYHSQQIGDLFLEQTGDSVVGEYGYDRANCHATGHIEGTLQGNLLRFTWTESQAACGRLAPLRGRGWFIFWKDSAGNGRVNGEWGSGDADTGGGPWSGFRDRVRRQPGEQQRGAAPASSGGVFNDAPATSPAGRPSTPAQP